MMVEAPDTSSAAAAAAPLSTRITDGGGKTLVGVDHGGQVC